MSPACIGRKLGIHSGQVTTSPLQGIYMQYPVGLIIHDFGLWRKLEKFQKTHAD